MRVFFTSRPERVLAEDEVFTGMDLAKVCGVPGVRRFCDELVWVVGGQAFIWGQDFTSAVAWDTGSDVAGLLLVPVLESQVGLEGYAPTSSSGGLCCGNMLSHWPRPLSNGHHVVE